MTERAQQIAIAKAYGYREFTPDHPGVKPEWKQIRGPLGIISGVYADSESAWDQAILPDYLGDLNAMAKAEGMLDEDQFIAYATELARVMFNREAADGYMVRAIAKLIHATAAQRAEALLRVLGKWVEES